LTSVKDFTVTQVGYTRYFFIHNSELGHHLSEWQSSTRQTSLYTFLKPIT